MNELYMLFDIFILYIIHPTIYTVYNTPHNLYCILNKKMVHIKPNIASVKSIFKFNQFIWLLMSNYLPLPQVHI